MVPCQIPKTAEVLQSLLWLVLLVLQLPETGMEVGEVPAGNAIEVVATMTVSSALRPTRLSATAAAVSCLHAACT